MKSMKNIKWLSGVFIMLLGLSVFSACSEDEDTKKPNFPEKQLVDCSVGEEKTLTFNAEYAWTLASSKLWCKFKDGKDVVSSLSGGAGQHTITITVTEDIWSFEDAVAELKLGMEGEIQVIAVVNRAAKLYHIEAYLQNGEDKIPYDETHPVDLLYSGMYTDVTIVANFGWKVKNCPEWVEVEEAKLMGEAGKVMEWTLKFKSTNNFPKYDEQKATLEFVDKNGATRLTIPVEYAGMPEDEVEFTRPQKDYWNWVFSSDASQYWQASIGDVGGGTTKFDAPLNFTAMAKDELELVYLKIDQWGYTPVEVSYPGAIWFKATLLEDHKVELRVDPNDGKERQGCLMVVPAKILAGLADGIYDLVEMDGSSIKPTFERYIAFEFTQQSAEASNRGFDIKDGPATSLNSRVQPMQMPSDELIAMFGTDNVYMLTLDAAKSYETIIIQPKGYPNGVCQYELNGNTQEWGDIYVEPDYQKGLFFSNISKGEKSEITIHIKNGAETYAVLAISQYYD